MPNDPGKPTEDLIEAICSRMFFSDFTVRSPKFQKASGEQKEAADLLVTFDDYLLAFQVKTKSERKSASQKSELDFDRIRKTVVNAIDQLKTTKRALQNKRLSELTTVRGLKIPFDSNLVEKLIGIVILDLLGEEEFPEEEQTALYGGYDYQHDMPVHIFLREDFETIATEVDTLPDFLEYLSVRERFLSSHNLWPFTSELDFLALYKSSPEILDSAIEKNAKLYIQEGIWEHYCKEQKALIEQRNALNKPSYLVDAVIEWMHSSVGFYTKTHHIIGRKDSFQGTIEGYLSVSLELAKFPRLQRRMIGERMLRCAVKAEQKGHAHSLILDHTTNSGVLVAASPNSREERMRMLYNISAIAYCKYKLKKLIAIVTEPTSDLQRSSDVFLLNGVSFENAEELALMASSTFGSENHVYFNEYQGIQ